MSRKKKNKSTGFDALAEGFNSIDHGPLLAALGVNLSRDLLAMALTHRSFANENGHLPNNERLEFLGDAVLGMTIAGALYNTYSDRSEADISKMRASMVSRYGLADIAREIDLGSYILLGHGEVVTGGRDKDSILADTTEAIFGAIYLEFGFYRVRDVILSLFANKIAHASSSSLHMDWKTTLQERLAENKLPMPIYTSESTGPDHDRTFKARVLIADECLGRGTGPNKKTAEQLAAQQSLAEIKKVGVVSKLRALIEEQEVRQAAESTDPVAVASDASAGSESST